MPRRSVAKAVLIGLLAFAPAGCTSYFGGNRVAEVYPNINLVPPQPTGHLLSPGEAAAEAAQLQATGAAARRTAAADRTAQNLTAAGAALSKTGAAQSAAGARERACFVAQGQTPPAGCPAK